MIDIDMGALATTAMNSALAYLGSKAKELADDATKAAGDKVIDWLRSKLTTPAEKEALKKLEANPDSLGAQRMVEGALLSRLEESKPLAEDLENLLKAAGVNIAVTQTMTIKGKKNIGTQAAGSGNVTKVGRD